MESFNGHTIPTRCLIKIKIDELSNDLKLSLIDIKFGQNVKIDSHNISLHGYFLKIENNVLYLSTQDPLLFSMTNPCSEIPLNSSTLSRF